MRYTTTTPTRARTRFYILHVDGKTVVEEPDAVKWQRWMSHAPTRILKQDVLPNAVFVSTVFIGVGEQLWQTAVFGDEPLEDRFYMTYEAAAKGHAAVVALILGGLRGRVIRFRE